MPVPDGYTLRPVAPPVDDYVRLRRDAGLREKSAAQALPVVTRSWSFCHVTEDRTGEVVAMGRVLGDGGWYFVVADMVTLPDHQRRGIGRAVLDHLVADIRDRAPDGAYVSLTADAAGIRLYERAGFTRLTTGQTAMQRVLSGERGSPPRG